MSRLQSIFHRFPKLLTSAAGFDVCNAKLQATALTTIRKAVSLPSLSTIL
jgi:hypothetical protein